MAAITPTVPAAGQETAKPYLGMRHEVHAYASIANNDTWTLPGAPGGKLVKWALEVPAGSQSLRIASYVAATSVMTFTGASVVATYVHLWFKG